MSAEVGEPMNNLRKAVLVLIAGGIAVTGCASNGGKGVVRRSDGAGAAASPMARRYDALIQASCKVSIRVPNLGIYSTRTYSVKATWTRCGASGASWHMKRGNEFLGFWSFPPSPQYEFYWPGYEPLGRFSAMPTGAHDSNYNSVPQNGSTFYIKLNSRVGFSGYRSGRNVFVRARVIRYNPNRDWGTGGWQNSVSRRVGFYDKVGGRWRWRGARYTGGNGYTRYLRLGAPTRRQFRAIVRPTSTLWGRNSNTNTR